MGERSAVRPKSGKSVSQSDPGLRRPTPQLTAGRKPAARPSDLLHSLIDPKSDSTTCEAEGSQRKTGQGAGQSPAERSRRAALGSFTPSTESDLVLPYDLNDSQITALIEFFQILDRWDREAHGPQVQ